MGAVRTVLVTVLVAGTVACGTDSPMEPAARWTKQSCPSGVSGQHLIILMQPERPFLSVNDTLVVTTSVSDAQSRPMVCNVVLEADSTRLRIVDGSKLIARQAGPVRLIARVPLDSLVVDFNVGPPVGKRSRRYTLTDVSADVGDGAYFGKANDRDEILLSRLNTYILWRRGIVITVSGCDAAYDLNNLGQIACRRDNSAYIWQNGILNLVLQLQSVLPQYNSGLVLNDSGAIGGWAWQGGTKQSVFLLPSLQSRFVNQLDGEVPPPFFPWTTVRLNNRGQMLLTSFRGGYETLAYVIDTNRVVASTGTGIGGAYDLSDDGTMVGSTGSHPSTGTAFVALNGTETDLGFGVARSINQRDEVVGTLTAPMYDFEKPAANPALVGPFYWEGSAGVLLLRDAATDPSWVITSALHISNSGTIVAMADNPSRGLKDRLVLLTPQ